MTNQHTYMARLIRESSVSAETKMFAALVIVRTAENFNARFDRAQFMRACGLEWQ